MCLLKDVTTLALSTTLVNIEFCLFWILGIFWARWKDGPKVSNKLIIMLGEWSAPVFQHTYLMVTVLPGSILHLFFLANDHNSVFFSTVL